MKRFAKLAALGVAAFFTAAVASATTMQFGSYSTADPMNAFGNQNTPLVFVPGLSTAGPGIPTTSATQDVSPGSVWHASLPNSSWVSWGPTGPTSPPNLAPLGFYAFQSSFTLPGDAIGFSFSVLADDTVQVYIDGNTGSALFMDAPGGNTICQNAEPNCLNVDTVTSASLPPAVVATILSQLKAGPHVATFVVEENFPIDMGVDFSATVDIVPEPSSLLLLGTGLIGSAGLIMRKVRARA